MSEPERFAIETEQFGPTTTVTASCRDCVGADPDKDWNRKGFTGYDGRNVRAAARQHAARKGHRVMVHVERLSSVEIRPVRHA